MLTELARLREDSTQAGEMAGYPGSSTGFPANFQIGVASAADSGLPNAQTAWSIFDSRSVKPSGSGAYNNYPNFAVIPRSMEAGTQPPPTMPPTLYPPTSSTPPLVTITPPPVPKELPARKCTSVKCGGAVQPTASNAEPVRTTIDVVPATQANSGTAGAGAASGTTVSGNVLTTGKVQAPPTTVRFLVRVVCSRFDSWCKRFLPQAVYVPTPAAAYTPRAADTAAQVQPRASASPVAPALTSRISEAYAPTDRVAGRISRR
jgi:hypothetical protein